VNFHVHLYKYWASVHLSCVAGLKRDRPKTKEGCIIFQHSREKMGRKALLAMHYKLHKPPVAGGQRTGVWLQSEVTACSHVFYLQGCEL
jgi:hypothetical protein